MKCPTCKAMTTVGMGLDSDQFHEEINTCSICGTIWSVNHEHVEIISDSQEGSFLDVTGDPVEADDYKYI